MPKAILPPGEAQTDMDIYKGIATYIGKPEEIYGSEEMPEIKKTAYAGAKATLEAFGNKVKESYDEFVKKGIASISDLATPNIIPMAYYRTSVDEAIPYGLCTSTGKFEAYSISLVEDYEARRYNNFDTAGGTLATGTDTGGSPFEGKIHTKACEYKNVEDTPNTALQAATIQETADNESSARFVYPIPMYIPLIEGTHACDSDGTLGSYPAQDTFGATKHPDLFGVANTHKYLLNTFHSIKRAHSTMNNNALVNETFKIGDDGAPAFLDPDRNANKGGEDNPAIWDSGVYEPVYIHPDDAVTDGISHGDKLKLTSIRGTAIYAAAHVTKTVRKGHLAMAEGAWVSLDENGIDIGGAVNTLFSLRPSRIARGTTMGNGLRVKIQKA
jgi:anaerobic dimethyl sulfoxide reductase subunit A